MEMKFSKEQHEYLMQQLKKMEDKKEVKVPHLDEKTKITLGLVGN